MFKLFTDIIILRNWLQVAVVCWLQVVIDTCLQKQNA